MKKNIAVQVLDFIAAAGLKGRSFSEIQKFAWHASHGDLPYPKNIRGWWCDSLLGGWGHRGLLKVFCTRPGPKGRWIRNSRHHFGTPFAMRFQRGGGRIKLKFSEPWQNAYKCSTGRDLPSSERCAWGTCT